MTNRLQEETSAKNRASIADDIPIDAELRYIVADQSKSRKP